MIATLKEKQVKNCTSPTAKALVLIDLGNGDVKALGKMNGTRKFVRCCFPSHVAIVPTGNSDCLSVLTADGPQPYLVGQSATNIACTRTGKSADGKVKNARLLLFHALRQMFGSAADIHADVIFTSPSVKSYGPAIVSQIIGRHPVEVPADAEVIGSTPQRFAIHIHSATPQLEGYQAFAAVRSKLKGESAYLIDIGNRTVLVTHISASGRILNRRPFDECGVWSIADRIVSRESLAAQLKTPRPQQVIDYLLDAKHGPEMAEQIAPDISASLAEAIAFIGDDKAQRFILGGGAKLPGIEQIVSGKALKNPQWANLEALAAVSDELLKGVK